MGKRLYEDCFIWVPGWGASESLWRKASSAIPEAEHRYVSFRGCTSSSEMVQAVVDQLDDASDRSERCHIVGWSMGGMLSIEAASKWLWRTIETGKVSMEDNVSETSELGEAARRDMLSDLQDLNGKQGLLASLVLVGTTLCFVDAAGMAGWPPRVLQRMRRRLAEAPEQTRREFAARLLTVAERQQHPHLESLMIERFQVEGHVPAELDAGLAYLASADATDAWVQLCAARLPVLWLHGEEDPLVPAVAQDIARRLAGPSCRSVEYRRLTGQGHVPFLTNRSEWDKEVKRWHASHSHLI